MGEGMDLQIKTTDIYHVDIPYTPALWIWIIMPPLFGLLIGLAGHWSSRKILAQSPLILLRDT